MIKCAGELEFTQQDIQFAECGGHVQFNFACTPCLDVRWRAVANVTNRDSQANTYQFLQGDGAGGGTLYGSGVSVSPGNTGSLTIEIQSATQPTLFQVVRLKDIGWEKIGDITSWEKIMCGVTVQNGYPHNFNDQGDSEIVYDPSTNAPAGGTGGPINWDNTTGTTAAPGTPATDLTLQQGFNAVYDAVTKFARENDSNHDRLHGVAVDTKGILQDIRGYTQTIAAKDFAPVITLSNNINPVLTNNLTITNQLTVTNQLTITNNSSTNWFPEITNWLGGIKTEVADLEAALLEYTNSFPITNAVTVIVTNVPQTNAVDTNMPDVDAQYSAGLAAASEAQQPFLDAVGMVSIPDYTIAGGGSWTVNIAGYSVDFNPLNNSELSSLANFWRTLFTWLSTVLYVAACWAATDNHIRSIALSRQTRAETDVPIAGTAVALVIAGVVTTTIASVPAVGMAIFTGHSGTLNSSPFTGLTGMIAAGASLADAFFPFDVVCTQLVGYVVFRVSLAGTFTFVATIIRFLVG